MKPELVLHIGTPKTGTTSLQFVFSVRRAQMLKAGILFPSSPGHDSHGLLAAAALGEEMNPRHFFPAIWEGLTPAARLALFRTEFARELSEAPPHVHTVVISSEHCWFLKGQRAIERMADILKPHFDRFRIVCYLRRQDLFAASSYNERLRVGETSEPALPVGDLAEAWGWNYKTMLNAWAAVFGEKAIVVRIFERGSLKGGDVVDDFLATCGLAVDIPAADPNRARNTSISLVAQRLMILTAKRFVETRGPKALDGADWRRMGNAYSNASRGRGWLPTRSEAQAFMAQFEPSNEAVRARFLPERPSLFGEGYDALAERPVTCDDDEILNQSIDTLNLSLQNAAKIRSDDLLHLARVYRRLGESSAAKKFYAEAIWNNPLQVVAHVELAHEMLREGDVAGAREYLKRAQEIQPNSPQVQNLVARVARAGSSPQNAAPTAVGG